MVFIGPIGVIQCSMVSYSVLCWWVARLLRNNIPYQQLLSELVLRLISGKSVQQATFCICCNTQQLHCRRWRLVAKSQSTGSVTSMFLSINSLRQMTWCSCWQKRAYELRTSHTGPRAHGENGGEYPPPCFSVASWWSSQVGEGGDCIVLVV